VLTDLKMPGMTGVEVIRGTETLAPFHHGYYSYGYGSVETAVGSDESGGIRLCDQACRRDELLVVIQRALEFQRLHHENVSLRKQLKAKYKFE